MARLRNHSPRAAQRLRRAVADRARTRSATEVARRTKALVAVQIGLVLVSVLAIAAIISEFTTSVHGGGARADVVAIDTGARQADQILVTLDVGEGDSHSDGLLRISLGMPGRAPSHSASIYLSRSLDSQLSQCSPHGTAALNSTSEAQTHIALSAILNGKPPGSATNVLPGDIEKLSITWKFLSAVDRSSATFTCRIDHDHLWSLLGSQYSLELPGFSVIGRDGRVASNLTILAEAPTSPQFYFVRSDGPAAPDVQVDRLLLSSGPKTSLGRFRTAADGITYSGAYPTYDVFESTARNAVKEGSTAVVGALAAVIVGALTALAATFMRSRQSGSSRRSRPRRKAGAEARSR